MVKRAAFTLIELVFAIVVIAIAVVSLPVMNSVISSGVNANVVQEAIFASSTEINEVTTAHWDDNSLEVNATNSFARVIDEEGNCDDTTRRMPGHVMQTLHRRCLDSNTTTPADANVTDEVTSLDDFEHNSQNIFTDTTTDDTGYKRQYESTLTISRPATFDGVSNNDIKLITISIDDVTDPANPVPITTLKTYSANIGEIDYYKMEY